MNNFDLLKSSVFYSDKENSHFWLMVNGTPIAFARAVYDSDENIVVLYEIEVRDIYRGYGYGKIILDLISEHYMLPVHSEGIYTPLGWKAFGSHLPLMPGGIIHVDQFDDKQYRFVKDWDNLVPEYELKYDEVNSVVSSKAFAA